MNKWELAHHFVMETMRDESKGIRTVSELAADIVQRLVDEGIIQSTVENDLRGDVS